MCVCVVCIYAGYMCMCVGVCVCVHQGGTENIFNNQVGKGAVAPGNHLMSGCLSRRENVYVSPAGPPGKSTGVSV